MHKCNKSDKGSKQEHKLHPVICNGTTNAKSPQVWTHFQRLKLSMSYSKSLMFAARARKREPLPAPRPFGRKAFESFDVDTEHTLINLMSVFQFTLLLALHATHVQLLEVFCILHHCNK